MYRQKFTNIIQDNIGLFIFAGLVFLLSNILCTIGFTLHISSRNFNYDSFFNLVLLMYIFLPFQLSVKVLDNLEDADGWATIIEYVLITLICLSIYQFLLVSLDIVADYLAVAFVDLTPSLIFIISRRVRLSIIERVAVIALGAAVYAYLTPDAMVGIILLLLLGTIVLGGKSEIRKISRKYATYLTEQIAGWSEGLEQDETDWDTYKTAMEIIAALLTILYIVVSSI